MKAAFLLVHLGMALAQLQKDSAGRQLYPGLVPLEFNSQFGAPIPQYNFDPARGYFPSQPQPQVFFYGAGPGQPFLLSPGSPPPGNFLYPQPQPAQPGPDVLFRNPNEPQRPVFVAGYPKPAHIPPIEKDAEEIPTNPSKVPPFQPKKPTGNKPEKIENFNETPNGSEADNLEPKTRHIPEPNIKPGHRFFVLNGHQLFNYPNVFGATPELSQYSQNAPVVPILPNNLPDQQINNDNEEKLPQQPQPLYHQQGQPILIPYNIPGAENQYVPLIPQQQNGINPNFLRTLPGNLIQHPSGQQNIQQQYPVVHHSYFKSGLPLNNGEIQINFPVRHGQGESLPGSELVAGENNEDNENSDVENDAVVIDAKESEEPKNEAVVQTPRKTQQSSLSQAGPGAIALAGEGGVAAASPRGTAFVGKEGLAVSSPKATAIAGPEKESKNVEFGAKKDKKKVTTTEKSARPTRERTSRRLVKSRFQEEDKKEE